MSRPQPEALAAFQRQRSAQRRNAVLNAIRQLDRAAQPVTVASVAGLAGVDRAPRRQAGCDGTGDLGNR